MRRLPVFVAVGPPLCWLVFTLIAWVGLDYGPFDEGGQMFVATLFGSFGITLPFMIALAWLDHRLARFRWRALACGLAGFAAAVAAYAQLTWETGSAEQWDTFGQYWFFVGLILGVPGAVCSWLGGLYAP